MSATTTLRYRARDASGSADLAALAALRAEVFPADRSAFDPIDALCQHVLVEEDATGRVVCGFRLLSVADSADLARTYAARHYDLAALGRRAGPMVELGRFCVRPGVFDPDILRMAWAALTRIVDDEGAGMIFGCTSFRGTDAAAHADALAVLWERHVAPPAWRPRIKAPRVIRLAPASAGPVDPVRARAAMPPLLRSYLGMGGRVSDHAVIDEEMGTLHVFTGLEIGAIPAARRRLLRALAAPRPAWH